MKEQLDSARADARLGQTGAAPKSAAAANPKISAAKPLNPINLPPSGGESSEEEKKSRFDSQRLSSRLAGGGQRETAPSASAGQSLARKYGGLSSLASAAGGGGATAALQPFSKEFLRQSWLNLIDSVGLTFLYLIFHFIVRYVAGSKILCRFGEEGAFGLIPSSVQTTISSAGGEENIINKGTELAEIIVFFVILIVLIISAIIQFIITMLPVLIVAGVITFGIKAIF